MVHGRISPTTKDRFLKTIRDVVKGLSKKVLIYKHPIKVSCENCHYDKLTDKSTGKCRWTIEEAEQLQNDWELQYPGQVKYKWFRIGRCPICKGIGYQEIKRKAWADCLVSWNPTSGGQNSMTMTPAGHEGSTIVQLKTDPKYYDLFKNCVSLIVDGIECKLSKPPILRGLGNQALLVIFAFTTDKPKVDSGEIIKEYT